MTILEALKSLSGYPVAISTIERITQSLSLDANAEITNEMHSNPLYKRATAEVYMFLIEAPTVSQGGVHYAISNAQRTVLKKKVAHIYAELGLKNPFSKPKFGYKGSDF